MAITPPKKPTVRTPGSRRASLGKLIAIGLVLIVFVGYGVVAVLVYGVGREGTTIHAMTRWVALPAARVNGRAVPYDLYLEEKRAVAQYTSALASTTNATFPSSTATEHRQTSLTKLIRESALMDLLAERNLRVSSADLDQAFSAQILQFGNAQEIDKVIADLYGWTSDEFKDHVLTGVVAREKMREALSFDERLNGASKQQAEKVYALVQEGKQSFEELAKTYSEDPNAAKAGDTGLFGRGTYASEIEDAAFRLEVGNVSELIHTKYGWHIIKLVEKKTVDNQEQVRLQQIYISAPSVDAYLTARLQKFPPDVYAKGLRWDNEKGNVVTR